MLNYFEEKKETFLDYKKREFFKVQKIAFFFSKGLIHTFGQKMPFFLYFHLVKIRLEIMLMTLQRKKKPVLTIKTEFFKVQKIHFSKGKPIYAFGQKMPFFSLVRFGQNNTRNNA